jgi:abequosyltransferase
MTIKLSICIPTYNRSGYLSQTIESIVSQSNNQIEIVISDNASTDNTSELVNTYIEKHENIIYYKSETNQGADINFLRAVELARGKYCWLLGSDDVIVPNVLSEIIQKISSGNDIYLFNRYECDRNLQVMGGKSWINSSDKAYEFSSQNNQLITFIDEFMPDGIPLGFMSTNIINKEKWDSITLDNELINTGYVHVYKIFELINKGNCSLSYISKPYIYQRSNNDSLLSEVGDLKRYLIDLNAFEVLRDRYFKKTNALEESICKLFNREQRMLRLIKLRSRFQTKRDWSDFSGRLKAFKYSYTKLFVINLIGKNRILVESLIKLRRRVRVS